CLVLALVVFVRPDPPVLNLNRAEAEHARATFVMVAIWFTVFSLPLFLFTPDTPSTGNRLRAAAREGIQQLIESIRHVRRYSHILRFLIGRMIYTEGVSTMFL